MKAYEYGYRYNYNYDYTPLFLKKRARASLTSPPQLPVAALLISPSPLLIAAVPKSQCDYAFHL